MPAEVTALIPREHPRLERVFSRAARVEQTFLRLGEHRDAILQGVEGIVRQALGQHGEAIIVTPMTTTDRGPVTDGPRYETLPSEYEPIQVLTPDEFQQKQAAGSFKRKDVSRRHNGGVILSFRTHTANEDIDDNILIRLAQQRLRKITPGYNVDLSYDDLSRVAYGIVYNARIPQEAAGLVDAA